MRLPVSLAVEKRRGRWEREDFEGAVVEEEARERRVVGGVA